MLIAGGRMKGVNTHVSDLFLVGQIEQIEQFDLFQWNGR